MSFNLSSSVDAVGIKVGDMLSYIAIEFNWNREYCVLVMCVHVDGCKWVRRITYK